MSAPLVTASVRTAADIRALFVVLAHAAEERCGFAFLDPDWRLLGVHESAAGYGHGVHVPLRAAIADALRLGARAVVMAHNHPGGDLRPSSADVAATRRAIAAFEAIDVRLIDHVVLGAAGYASMRDMGLL